jgi:signal transduction histidine kinase
MSTKATKSTAARWVTGPIFGIADMGWGDVALTVALSALAVFIVTHGRSHGHRLDAGWEGSLAVLLMTVPILFARRNPPVVAGVLLGGTLLNWGLIGHYVRCGATLPAVFFVAFVIGSRCQGRQRLWGEVLVIGCLLAQCASDPQVAPVGNVALFAPISLAFLGAGYLLYRRNQTVEVLRARTTELQEQRDQNARLAVEADRARISDDLDGFLHERVAEIASAAATGRATLDDSGNAQDAFVSIQDTGRQTLTYMRDVVGSLREQPPTGPQPVLAQLDRLLAQAGTADMRLSVMGDPRLLPPGLELAGYRIVEHLLLTLENNPSADASVEVVFGADSLELKVVGPSVRESAARAALAAVKERATVHGGSVRTSVSAGRRETLVVLPLAAGGV